MRLPSAEIAALLLAGLTGHVGAAAAQDDPKLAKIVESQTRLENLRAALEMFQLDRERFPTREEGLAILLGPSQWGPVYLEGGEEMLLDAWGVPFQNQEPKGFLEDLRSFGPDGIGGNDDDLWVAPGGTIKGGVPTPVPELEDPAEEPPYESGPKTEASPAEAATEPGAARARLLLHPRGKMAPGDEIVDVAMLGNGDVAWVAKRGDRMVLCTPTFESEPVHRIYPGIFTGTVPGAVAVMGSHGGQRFVLTPQGRQPYTDLVKEPVFLDGTTVLAFRDLVFDELYWTIGGAKEPMVDAPVLDSDGRFVAYREQRDDGWYMVTGASESGPHKWVSQPMVLPLANGDVLFHRRWDGTETCVVAGDRLYRVTWARDPVVSPDGASYALAVNMGGVPSADFEELRERSWKPDSVLPRAFDGGEYHVVNDWTQYESYDYVGDPIYSLTGEMWAHLAYTEEGMCLPVLRSKTRVVNGPRSAAVSHLRIDLTGEMVNFQATDPATLTGQSVLSLHRDAEHCEDAASGSIVESLPGQRAFCGVLEDEGRYLFHEGKGEPAVRYGPFDRVRLLGKLISDHPVAHVQRDGQNFLFADCEYGPFDRMSELAFGPWDVLGVSMKVGDEYEVRHINTPGKEDGWSRYGGLAWAGTPTFLTDGSMRTPVRLKSEPDSHYWLYWSYSEYQLIGPFEGLSPLTLSDDGAQYAWASKQDGLWRLRLWGESMNFEGPPHEGIHDIRFGHGGRLIYRAETRDGDVIVDDGVPGQAYDRIAAVDLDEGRQALAYRADVGEKLVWVVGGIQGPILDLISTEFVWSEDGRFAAYMGFEADSPGSPEGSWMLLVADTSTGSTFVADNDMVSEPTVGDDQRSVLFAAQKDDQVYFAEWKFAEEVSEPR